MFARLEQAVVDNKLSHIELLVLNDLSYNAGVVDPRRVRYCKHVKDFFYWASVQPSASAALEALRAAGTAGGADEVSRNIKMIPSDRTLQNHARDTLDNSPDWNGHGVNVDGLPAIVRRLMVAHLQLKHSITACEANSRLEGIELNTSRYRDLCHEMQLSVHSDGTFVRAKKTWERVPGGGMAMAGDPRSPGEDGDAHARRLKTMYHAMMVPELHALTLSVDACDDEAASKDKTTHFTTRHVLNEAQRRSADKLLRDVRTVMQANESAAHDAVQVLQDVVIKTRQKYAGKSGTTALNPGQQRNVNVLERAVNDCRRGLSEALYFLNETSSDDVMTQLRDVGAACRKFIDTFRIGPQHIVTFRLSICDQGAGGRDALIASFFVKNESEVLQDMVDEVLSALRAMPCGQQLCHNMTMAMDGAAHPVLYKAQRGVPTYFGDVVSMAHDQVKTTCKSAVLAAGYKNEVPSVAGLVAEALFAAAARTIGQTPDGATRDLTAPVKMPRPKMKAVPDAVLMRARADITLTRIQQAQRFIRFVRRQEGTQSSAPGSMQNECCGCECHEGDECDECVAYDNDTDGECCDLDEEELDLDTARVEDDVEMTCEDQELATSAQGIVNDLGQWAQDVMQVNGRAWRTSAPGALAAVMQHRAHARDGDVHEAARGIIGKVTQLDHEQVCKAAGRVVSILMRRCADGLREILQAVEDATPEPHLAGLRDALLGISVGILTVRVVHWQRGAILCGEPVDHSHVVGVAEAELLSLHAAELTSMLAWGYGVDWPDTWCLRSVSQPIPQEFRAQPTSHPVLAWAAHLEVEAHKLLTTQLQEDMARMSLFYRGISHGPPAPTHNMAAHTRLPSVTTWHIAPRKTLVTSLKGSVLFRLARTDEAPAFSANAQLRQNMLERAYTQDAAFEGYSSGACSEQATPAGLVSAARLDLYRALSQTSPDAESVAKRKRAASALEVRRIARVADRLHAGTVADTAPAAAAPLDMLGFGDVAYLSQPHPATGSLVHPIADHPHNVGRFVSHIAAQDTATDGPARLMDKRRFAEALSMRVGGPGVLAKTLVKGTDMQDKQLCANLFFDLETRRAMQASPTADAEQAEITSGHHAVFEIIRRYFAAWDLKGYDEQWRANANAEFTLLCDTLFEDTMWSYETTPGNIMGFPSGLWQRMRSNADTYFAAHKYAHPGARIDDTWLNLNLRAWSTYDNEGFFAVLVMLLGYRPYSDQVVAAMKKAEITKAIRFDGEKIWHAKFSRSQKYDYATDSAALSKHAAKWNNRQHLDRDGEEIEDVDARGARAHARIGRAGLGTVQNTTGREFALLSAARNESAMEVEER